MAPPPDPIASLRDSLRGHYEIVREIGQGAFATVYLARDLKHERQVALKVLHADPTSETGELRFIREIRLLARLQHPHILPLHDSGHVETLLYYVMPYVSGDTLRDRIERERQLPIDTACSIARDVADALAYAHGQGIIHRDIKPENILLSAGHPVLADFGIARVIDLAGVRQLTRTGMGSPGTPAYMSPEQLMGDKELDGRSDTYSLGCVLFEMIAGKPPFSGKEGFVKRFTEPPPSVRSIRRDAPAWLDDVIGIALARSPSDRYQTAQDLVNALALAGKKPDKPVGLDRALAARGGPARAAKPNRVGVYHEAGIDAETVAQRASGPEAGSGNARIFAVGLGKNWRVAALLALVVVFMAVAIRGLSARSWPRTLFASEADSTRLALIPFAGSAAPGERERISNAFYAALSDWRGLRLASDEDIAELTRSDGPPTSTRAAADLARRVGAGRFIWGQLSATNPSSSRVQLYEVSSGVPLRSVRFESTSAGSDPLPTIRELLKRAGRPASADGGDGRTRSFPAWDAYGRGHIAIAEGDFAAAEKEFRSAINEDPAFGAPHVWLAQTLAWQGRGSRADWRSEATLGLTASMGLAERDRKIAVALTHMANGRYPEACAAYSQILKADSLDFVGQFGIGQCQAADSLVIRSPRSPSGWAFRSRYSDAATAYMRALSTTPSAHSLLSFDQLQELLPISSNKTRQGRTEDGQRFAAYPAKIRDTVVFVPYPLAEFAALPAGRTAAGRNAAIEANLKILLEFATDWTLRAPASSMAYQALSDVLEARGEISLNRSGGLSAIDAILKARQTAATPAERQAAAAREAWLRFKQNDFSRARIIADSLLTWSISRPDDARLLIGLAGLTGRIGRTADLARLTYDYATSPFTLPAPVTDAAASFFAFAAFGVCSDSTRALERGLDDQIARFVAEADEERVKRAVKARPLSMLGPCNHGSSSLRVEAQGSKLLRLQQAFARGDAAALEALLQGVADDARTQRPGDVSLDFTYQVAWLRSAIGDTTGAVRQLDRALGALPSLTAVSLRDPAAAAAAGRAMMLRAELANAAGQTDVQGQWSRAVLALWANADPPLRPAIARMQNLAAQAIGKQSVSR